MNLTPANKLMEKASLALVAMDYLACEEDCLAALALAQDAGDWNLYARILLPLQECRRQRRMTAADGWVLLGCDSLDQAINSLQHGPGCMVLTHPITLEQAKTLSTEIHKQKRFVELLFADSKISDQKWKIRSLAGPAVSVTIDAPPASWQGRLLTQNEPAPADTQSRTPKRGIALRPSDWFLNVTEKLGDHALATVTAPAGTLERVTELLACMQVMVDHEILHQQLAQAARSLIKHPA